MHLCSAESCTGGLLGHIITNYPGASQFYLGGQITYSNQTKHEWLHVPEQTLIDYGAVSEQTVIAMAEGIRNACRQSCPIEKLVGIAISGIAGPSGGTPDKPVGTVWIGISMAHFQHATRFSFSGNREEIKQQSALQALRIIRDALSVKKRPD